MLILARTLAEECTKHYDQSHRPAWIYTSRTATISAIVVSYGSRGYCEEYGFRQ
jgi:hypothetical protein